MAHVWKVRENTFVKIYPDIDLQQNVEYKNDFVCNYCYSMSPTFRIIAKDRKSLICGSCVYICNEFVDNAHGNGIARLLKYFMR